MLYYVMRRCSGSGPRKTQTLCWKLGAFTSRTCRVRRLSYSFLSSSSSYYYFDNNDDTTTTNNNNNDDNNNDDNDNSNNNDNNHVYCYCYFDPLRSGGVRRAVVARRQGISMYIVY